MDDDDSPVLIPKSEKARFLVMIFVVSFSLNGQFLLIFSKDLLAFLGEGRGAEDEVGNVGGGNG